MIQAMLEQMMLRLDLEAVTAGILYSELHPSLQTNIPSRFKRRCLLRCECLARSSHNIIHARVAVQACEQHGITRATILTHIITEKSTSQ